VVISIPFGRLPPLTGRTAGFGGFAGPRPSTSPTCFLGVFALLPVACFFTALVPLVRAVGAALFAAVFVVRFVAGAGLVLLAVVLVAAATLAPERVAGRTVALRTAMTSPCSKVDARAAGRITSCKRPSSTD